MATERTVMLPDGMVAYFDTADQTVMVPSGMVVNAKITAPVGSTIPPLYHHYRTMKQA